jgi:uncharacterized lipoprotein
VTIFASCGMIKPKGWVSGSSTEAGWASILISDRVSYDLAFDDVMSILSRRGFEVEMITKEAGYIRTKWIYNWNTNGKTVRNYRVRVTMKLSEQRKRIDVNTEAELRGRKHWIRGYDTDLLETMRQDVAGVLGS